MDSILTMKMKKELKNEKRKKRNKVIRTRTKDKQREETIQRIHLLSIWCHTHTMMSVGSRPLMSITRALIPRELEIAS